MYVFLHKFLVLRARSRNTDALLLLVRSRPSRARLAPSRASCAHRVFLQQVTNSPTNLPLFSSLFSIFGPEKTKKSPAYRCATGRVQAACVEYLLSKGAHLDATDNCDVTSIM